VESTLQDAEYSHGKVPGWNNAITEGCMKKLKEMNKNYKYIGGSSHQTSTI
jgi:dynein light chain Tctex-type 1